MAGGESLSSISTLKSGWRRRGTVAGRKGGQEEEEDGEREGSASVFELHKLRSSLELTRNKESRAPGASGGLGARNEGKIFPRWIQRARGRDARGKGAQRREEVWVEIDTFFLPSSSSSSSLAFPRVIFCSEEARELPLSIPVQLLSWVDFYWKRELVSFVMTLSVPSTLLSEASFSLRSRETDRSSPSLLHS